MAPYSYAPYSYDFNHRLQSGHSDIRAQWHKEHNCEPSLCDLHFCGTVGTLCGLSRVCAWGGHLGELGYDGGPTLGDDYK